MMRPAALPAAAVVFLICTAALADGHIETARRICTEYGYRAGTVDFANCVRDEARAMRRQQHQQQRGSAPASQSEARFDGLWKFSVVTDECDFAFGSPFELQGGKFAGMVISSQDNGLRYLYGEIDASGKLSAFVSGDFVSVQIVGQFSGDKGSGTSDTSGETECTANWRATKIGGQ